PKLTLRGTASPILDGNQIIAGFANGKLVSLNAQTGEVNWQVTITVPRGRTDLERLSDIDGLFQISNGSVYVTSYQGRVASVSLSDGRIQWARKMSSYNGLSVSAGQLYISDTEGRVWSLDARTGATLWRQDNLTGREISTPVVMDNAVVVADYQGYTHWLSVEDGQVIARQSMDKVWNDAHEPDSGSFSDDNDSEDYPRLVTVSPYVMGDTLYVRDNTGVLAAFQVKSDSR
ncbi:MAG: PQQ-binding-like beta-propeller repeat protein, partial [Gammaproteobacteria bacterium]